MTKNSKEKLNTNENLWSKTLTYLLFGFAGSIAVYLFFVYLKNLRKEPLSTSEGVIDFVVFFFIIEYSIIIISEKYEDTILEVLSPSWRKVTATLRFWGFTYLAWVVLFVMRAIFLQQVPEIVLSLFDVFLVILLFALLFSSPIYSLAVYIPSSRYLASTQAKMKDKKEVADALTILTPVLGFPWILVSYLVLSFMNIQIEPDWINYIIFSFIYVGVFFLFVDFPYSSSIMEKKKQELESLEKERVALLENLQKVGGDTTKALLRKIAFESEIARIDRKQKEIKSQRVHPYKLIIPFASFFLGISGAIFIEIIKNLFQLA